MLACNLLHGSGQAASLPLPHFLIVFAVVLGLKAFRNEIYCVCTVHGVLEPEAALHNRWVRAAAVLRLLG